MESESDSGSGISLFIGVGARCGSSSINFADFNARVLAAAATISSTSSFLVTPTLLLLNLYHLGLGVEMAVVDGCRLMGLTFSIMYNRRFRNDTYALGQFVIDGCSNI